MVQRVKGTLWVFWVQEKPVDRLYLCQNRLTFGARLLKLKNKKVIEKDSCWELEEGTEKHLAWTGATYELDVVAAAQSKARVSGKGKSDYLQKQLSNMHSIKCWSENTMCLYPSAGSLSSDSHGIGGTSGTWWEEGT